jgi:signal peptidase II
MSHAASRPVWPLFAGLAALIVAADQAAKAWLSGFLAPGASAEVLDGWVRLVFSQNRGGLFGLLQGQVLAFAAMSIVVIGLIVAYHARSGRDPWLSLALGLLLGGAIGNLIDRLRFGYVIDFVDAGVGDLRWYTFNVADAAISTSLVLLLLLAFRAGVHASEDGGPRDGG